MIQQIITMVHNINDYHTPLGKVGLTLDGVGVALSVSFYALGLGEFINSVAPPIILALTVLSLSASLFFKVSSEYREWRQRRRDK
jgi:hypothetical protein